MHRRVKTGSGIPPSHINKGQLQGNRFSDANTEM